MKAATIVPTAYLGLIQNDDYHMCLGHLVGKDKAYTDFYAEMGKDPNKYVIMDNGAAEQNRRPIEELVEKAKICNAQEIILPDELMDTETTLNLSYQALEYVRSHSKLKVMAVPQGETLEEWLDCALVMIGWDIDCLGIPKILTRVAEHRDARLQALTLLDHYTRGLDIHLLGCWSTPIEITMIERAACNKSILPVRGVDSSIAYVYAREGILISQAERPSGAIDFKAKDADVSLLQENINIWRNAATVSDGKEKIVKLF